MPLETYLRGLGLNTLADKLHTAAAEVDSAMAQLPATGTPPDAVVQKMARALSALKYLAESEVAPALQISIGFSDADGD